MLGLHVVLVTLHRRFPISIEQDIELMALNIIFSVGSFTTYHQPQPAEVGFTCVS